MDNGEGVPLNLKEVRAHGLQGAVELLQPSTASQSSTYQDGEAYDGTEFPASKCIDGDIEGHSLVDRNMCHTQNEPSPWLAIDYGTTVTINKVEIFNREDGGGDRAKNVDVRVSNELPTSANEMFSGGSLLGHFAGPGTDGQHIIITGQAVSGRYVIVQMDNGEGVHLNLREVMAFGPKVGQQSGKIKSPLHPKNYPSNWNKTYDLEVASGSAIELTFESFDLERPHSTRGCIWDWVEVFDGDGTVLMKRSCGSGLDRLEGLQREELKKVISRSHRMSVEFHSDRRVTGTGFLAKWKKVAPPFGIAFSPPKNQVTSPDYPFNYPNNVISEEVEIGNPGGGGVHLTFDDFVLEESDGCELDFVQVLDENKKAISAKMCGSQIPGPITSPGNMTVVFHSDSSDRFRGFRATCIPA